MKVKNLRLKNKSILYGNKTIDFDNEGISDDLTKQEVKELTSLPFFEEVRGIKETDKIVDEDFEKLENETKEDTKEVEESKDIKKKGKAKKESK